MVQVNPQSGKSLNLGLIGCGRIAQSVHLNVLTHLPGVELVALAESDPQRREAACRFAPQTRAFADYRELLAMPEVEAVVICLPNALHAEVTVAALQQGKHVYLEKPLATSLDEARSVLAAWRPAGLVGMIGFNFRFHELYQAARRYIQSGRLGELVCVRSVFSSAARTLPVWQQARQTGGGVLLNLASHHVDLIHFLFEREVRDVSAGLQSYRSEDDSATLELRLSDGLRVQSFFSMNTVDEDRFEIYGEKGKLTVDRYHSLGVEITDPESNDSRLKWLGRGLRSLFRSPYLLDKVLAPRREPSYQAALSHFVAAAQADRPATPDLRDGYRSLAVIEAAEESARTGRVVSLSELADEDSAR